MPDYSHITNLSDDHARLPLYLRVAGSLRSRIFDGEWLAGAALPPIPDLTGQYKVATVTVRQALKLLSNEGLVNSARGRGTFVNEAVPARADDKRLREAISDTGGEAVGLTIKVLSKKKADALPGQLQSERAGYDQYVRVHKLHLLDGEPYALIEIFIAAPVFAHFPKGAEKRAKLANLLREDGQLDLVWSRQEITITYADHATAQLLKCPPMSALVRIRRWRADASDRIVYAGCFLYRGDRFVYDVEQSGTGDHFETQVVPHNNRVTGDQRK
jgi:GntR family transcriptional regulator